MPGDGATADDAIVDGDAAGLRTLLSNLVDNAVRYTPAGGRVDVAVQRDSRRRRCSRARLGPGHPRERARARVFDRFYRVPAPAPRSTRQRARPRDRQAHRRAPRRDDRARAGALRAGHEGPRRHRARASADDRRPRLTGGALASSAYGAPLLKSRLSLRSYLAWRGGRRFGLLTSLEGEAMQANKFKTQSDRAGGRRRIRIGAVTADRAATIKPATAAASPPAAVAVAPAARRRGAARLRRPRREARPRGRPDQRHARMRARSPLRGSRGAPAMTRTTTATDCRRGSAISRCRRPRPTRRRTAWAPASSSAPTASC